MQLCFLIIITPLIQDSFLLYAIIYRYLMVAGYVRDIGSGGSRDILKEQVGEACGLFGAFLAVAADLFVSHFEGRQYDPDCTDRAL
jgi:hypothetical protein